MNNIRESSQQDRRVYVGNLSYDVKWHHLKDFMRQGGFLGDPCRLAGCKSPEANMVSRQLERFSTPTCCCFRMECRRWAPMSDLAGSFVVSSSRFLMDCWIDGLGRCPR